ncbi:MAG: TIGR02221 family CRISPR-associated protein [Erysipelotrichia bacterium]|nr:TIGR02221 family CRISPR-associated protein [Erysipelotrichia bacterium]
MESTLLKKKNILLTSLGAPKKIPGQNVYSELKKTVYRFGDHTHESKFCCLALATLLQRDFDELYLLLTTEAEAAYGRELRTEAALQSLPIKIIEISSGKTIEEIWQMFDRITDTFNSSDECNVFLDISNGFRHLPLLSFASLTYLESSKKIRLAGVYYGAFDAKGEDGIAPVFDLTPLVNIIKGSYSVKAFEETGAIDSLGDFLNDLIDFGKNDQKSLTTKLQNLHGSINSGLPLEAGNAARELNTLIDRSLPEQNYLKAGKELIERLQSKIGCIKLSEELNKETFQLNIDELQRQLELIDWHITNQNPSIGTLLLREWIVNRVWLAEQPEGKWLQEKKRIHAIEQQLGYWGFHFQNKDFRKSIREKAYYELLKLWSQITGVRNQFAHAGFQEKNVDVANAHKQLSDLVRQCHNSLGCDEAWHLPKRDTNNCKILVSGMGASFGLLYSAVHLVKPNTVIVVTSEAFKDKAVDASVRAGFIDQNNLHIVTMHDVFCGFKETPALLENIWPTIQDAESLVINLTGGTTAMQWVMQSAFEKARNNNIPVERVAFVDRRSSVEQQQNPWHLGEIVEIEKMLKPPKKSE